MLSFESSEEQNVFLSFLYTETNLLLDVMGPKYNIYLGAVSPAYPATPDGFVWYKTGKSTEETVKLWWNTDEPNNSGVELCATIMDRDFDIGVNDYRCNFRDIYQYLNNTIVCQKMFNVTKTGFNHKY